MRRREFITLFGSAAAAWPLAARAQQADRIRQISVLVSGAEDDPEMQARLGGLREGLARLGWSEGRNIHVNYRFGGANLDRTQALAKEMVASRPDVLVAMATRSAVALQQETRSIPIVFVGIADPTRAGLIASIARPGGNSTGLLLYEQSIVGKWLGMLKEIAPGLTRVAYLNNPKLSAGTFSIEATALAPAFGVELVSAEIETAADVERKVAAFARAPNGGLLVLPDLTAVLHRNLIIGLAMRHRLPAIYQARFWVDAGGLMSYGSNRVADHRRAAYYVDRILHGANAADLPVQAPTNYEMVLNLKTAKALGLALPPGLLVAADEVIE